MITADFEGTDKTVPASLRAKLPKALQAVMLKMNQLTLKLQQKIVGEKLQGQVLAHRTGKLAASIAQEPATQDGDSVLGSVHGAGGVAFYGRFQNYGTEKSYEIMPKNKKALAFFPTGGIAQVNTQSKKQILSGFRSKQGSVRAAAYGKFNNLGGVVVKGVMHPPIEKRNFMESTLAEMREEFRQGLGQAAARGMASK